MIVISTVLADQSSSDVLDWLFDKKVIRVNNDNVAHELLSSVSQINFEDSFGIKSIWFRKGGYNQALAFSNPQITKYATEELYSLSGMFYTKTRSTITLGTTEFMLINKLAVLATFKNCGLEIPPTLLTTKKFELLKFIDEHKSVIVKSLSEGLRFQQNGEYFKIYTEKLLSGFIENLEETFFPSLFQKQINRHFEIRSFYLSEKIFSMAIFTPEESEIDHRIHIQNRNARMIPYQLPKVIEDKMISAMKLLDLDTGSFDIIKDIVGNYVFLEVNPSGQFGGLSNQCNYYLEREIANYLTNETK